MGLTVSLIAAVHNTWCLNMSQRHTRKSLLHVNTSEMSPSESRSLPSCFTQLRLFDSLVLLSELHSILSSSKISASRF